MKVKAFYTVREVAELLDVHEETVRRWIKDGKLESHRTGRPHMIPLSSLTTMASIFESLMIAGSRRE